VSPTTADNPSPRKPGILSLVNGGRERTIALACAVAIVLIFTSFNLISRVGTRSTLGVPDVAALRFGIGGLLMLHRRPIKMLYRDASKLAGRLLERAETKAATGESGESQPAGDFSS